MRRLYAQIAIGVMMALVAGLVAVVMLAPQLRSLSDRDSGADLLRSSLPWIGARLDAMPQNQWSQALSEVRQTFALPLDIVTGDSLPASVLRTVSNGHPTVINADAGAPFVYIPLHSGTHFLVAGPLPRPPILRLLAPALIFVFVLTVTASAVVGIPLVRRLRRLGNAIGELAGGDAAARLNANAEGALGELAESINRMATQLQEQIQERGRLLQVVSHEIGTPLSRMRFHIALLDEEIGEFDRQSRLRALSADLEELDELSTELVGWIERDPGGETKEAFAIGPLIEALIELECQGKNEGLTVTFSVPTGLCITADQRQFQRVLENLLRNALRYAQHTIVVEARANEGIVTVEVRDDGPGIPRENWARVLEPFVKFEDRSVKASRGLGLGLAIVRRILETHGGTVEVCDAPEGGTRVLTSWPSS